MKFKVPFWYLLVLPSALWIAGYFLNATVVAANHGQMPVEGPVECVFHAAETRNDYIHVCMDKDSKLKWLADWIYSPPDKGMASPGDYFMFVYEYTALPCWLIWMVLMVVGHKKDETCPVFSNTKKSTCRKSMLLEKRIRLYR
jgi:hypothetical protein